MKKFLISLALLAATLGLTVPAAAVVIPGSSYSIYLEGSESGTPFLGVALFDGVASTADRDGQMLTLNESETSLGGTNSLISINLSADSDLFPVLNETAILALGTDGNGLDFMTPVSLTDVRVTLRDLAGAVLFQSDNLVDLAVNNMPWDGTFPAPSSAFGIDQIGGMGVASITFDFSVTEFSGGGGGTVPEPGTLLLAGVGLLGLLGARRQRART